jgi:hypothetical protein
MEDSTRFRRPVAERHSKATARLQERHELSKCVRPFGRRDVHPDCAQQDQVEREAKTEHLVEARQVSCIQRMAAMTMSPRSSLANSRPPTGRSSTGTEPLTPSSTRTPASGTRAFRQC